MDSEQKEMIEKFQCPGCTLGCNTECVTLHKEGDISFWCDSHSAGTIIMGGKIALGLPKGFDKVGALTNSLNYDRRSTNIRLFSSSEKIFEYNFFNVPVWAMEKDGYLFIRTYCPRINISFVDVIKGGKREEICPDAQNVADFLDDID